jgi:hypothetical protein
MESGGENIRNKKRWETFRRKYNRQEKYGNI